MGSNVLCVAIFEGGIVHGLEDYEPGMSLVAVRWRGTIGRLVEDVARATETDGPPSGTRAAPLGRPGLRKIASAEASDIFPLSDVHEKTG